MKRRSLLLGLIACYLLVNAVIWAFANPDARLGEAPDGLTWYRPALALIAHGGFVDYDDPSKFDTYRGPLYPLFEAGAMAAAGGPSPSAIVVAQIALLLLVGLLFRAIVRDWMPGWENVAMALLLFNPNALSAAHFVQSEILFLAFVTLAFWAVSKYVHSGGKLRFALTTGLGIALACLTRPTAQFLLPVLPLLFPLLATMRHLVARRAALKHGLGALAVALMVLAPWTALVGSLGHGLALSDSAGKSRYVWDQVTMIEAVSKGLTYHEAAARLAAPGGAEYEFIARHGEAWKRMTAPQRNRAMADEGMTILLSYPVTDFATTLYRSQVQFYFGGGAGNWHNLLDIDTRGASKAWFSSAQDKVWALLARHFEGMSPAGLAFSVVTIGFAVVARLMGVVGLTVLAIRERWDLLLIVTGFVAYFAFVHIFVGNSRYRVTVEPMLMLLVVAGLDGVRRWTAGR